MPPRGRIAINEGLCKGCGLCVDNCPTKVLVLSPTKINLKGYHPAEQVKDGCIACAICATICPDAVITVYRENPVKVS